MTINRISVITAIGSALTAGSLMFSGPAAADWNWANGNLIPAAHTSPAT